MMALRRIQELDWDFLRDSPRAQSAPWVRQTVRYGLAVVLTACALLVRSRLDPLFHNSDAFTLFLLAAIAANWLCGLGPCLLALLLGALIGTWCFALPRGHFRLHGTSEWCDLATYLAAGLVVAWYGWARRKAEDRLASEVAQRIAAEASLRHSQETLEERVQERTEDLRHSVQSMRDFTYSIAHNLYAPLRATHGFAELLVLRCGPRLEGDAQAFAGRIRDAAGRMSNLLDALLMYGRIASVEAPLGAVETGEVINETVRRMRSSPASAGAQIEVQLPLPPVRANADLLTEVMLCLLHNAVKYVAPGVKPRVVIRAEPRDGCVRLRVEDNGVGIAPENHAEIFGAFNRLVPDGSPSTGMGLTIAHKAVERMHGKLGLESRPGQGSCFWVELPRIQ